MSTPWFHTHRLPSIGDTVSLDREEAKHATGVRRLVSGDSVTIFDGTGGVASAVLTDQRDRQGGIEVRVTSSSRNTRTGCDVMIGVAPPKGDRWSTMLDMLGQLAVSVVVPLNSSHGVIDAEGINRTRAERILLEAAKQSRSAWIAQLGAPRSLVEFIRGAIADQRVALVAHPGGSGLDLCRADRVALAVGPEGGFSAQEIEEARSAGADFVDLGPTILRVETAAVAMASVFRTRLPG